MSTSRSFRAAARAIESFGRQMEKRTPSGLRMIGEEIMTDVKSSRPGHGVPVDEGPLRASGRVAGPQRGEVELSFGGASAPYALRQHEDLTLNHTVGEARYLVRGVERWKPGQGAALAHLQREAVEAIRAARREAGA